ncbi:hypothetical protein GCM10010168_86000 [Actinoplanes ianthinogenes]|uniref:DUF4082 domain-containing protein n=1 Tax=Actinoplanes ianthinogenes TaxID=122358 RepID=A0ABN6CK26_9ACTN|nr:DUF4082 domain-containing protein [Actinoplanes ianthinogenes]BCJ45331.1 hypothetical protein Aiant_59880 [Actinoplanes ianthinogenes]GGR53823.1 hypothetical protein GCM10010168_86000 [Actinoplanes ianthinogenes]
MTAAKTRTGGAWVDSTKVAKVRVGGVWVDYGPSGGGTVTERFSYPTPPGLPNNDEAQRLNLGVLWSASASGSWIGNQVYTPSSVMLPDMTALAFTGSTELARKTATSPSVGQLVDILFDTPVAITASVTYQAAYSAVRYAATAGGSMTWPYTTAHMATGSGTPSRFAAGPVGTVPTNASAAGYHVTPIVQFSA